MNTVGVSRQTSKEIANANRLQMPIAEDCCVTDPGIKNPVLFGPKNIS